MLYYLMLSMSSVVTLESKAMLLLARWLQGVLVRGWLHTSHAMSNLIQLGFMLFES